MSANSSIPDLRAAACHSCGSASSWAKPIAASGSSAGSALPGTGTGCMWVSIALSRSKTMETVTGECQSENRSE